MTGVSRDAGPRADYEAWRAARAERERERLALQAALDERVQARLAARDAMHDRRRHWLDWQPAEFDGAARPVQSALFAEPDRMGTADMFADQP